MENISNILDFDDNGRAVIKIPRLQEDYSFILNHWQDIEIQLAEIENDLSHLEPGEKRSFLEKAKKIFVEYRESEDFKHKDNDDDSDDIDSDDDGLNDDGLDDDYLNDLFNDIDFDKFFLDEDNSDEQKLEMKPSAANTSLRVNYDEESEEPTLCVFHFKLEHSLAWYLMNRLDHEIAMIDQQIEKTSGLLKIVGVENNLHKAILTIRQSNSLLVARNKLMEEFQLTEIQAENILSMKLKTLTSTTEDNALADLRLYTSIKSILTALKR